jgi:hypothetical protein
MGALLATMAMTDLDAIRARHNKADVYRPVRQTLHGWEGGDTVPQCWECRVLWPCDAMRAVAEADRLRAALLDINAAHLPHDPLDGCTLCDALEGKTFDHYPCCQAHSGSR